MGLGLFNRQQDAGQYRYASMTPEHSMTAINAMSHFSNILETVQKDLSKTKIKFSDFAFKDLYNIKLEFEYFTELIKNSSLSVESANLILYPINRLLIIMSFREPPQEVIRWYLGYIMRCYTHVVAQNSFTIFKQVRDNLNSLLTSINIAYKDYVRTPDYNAVQSQKKEALRAKAERDKQIAVSNKQKEEENKE